MSTTVVPGTTYTITNGQGWNVALVAQRLLILAQTLLFKDASNVTLLTGGGGKGGK